MVGPGLCPMISKYGSWLSKAVGPVDPSLIDVKKSHFIKIFILHRGYEIHKTVVNSVKHVLSSHSKKDKSDILITNGSLMKVKSIAEHSEILLTCIKLYLAFFLELGPLRQVLLFNKQSMYIYAYKCLCQCR